MTQTTDKAARVIRAGRIERLRQPTVHRVDNGRGDTYIVSIAIGIDDGVAHEIVTCMHEGDRVPCKAWIAGRRCYHVVAALGVRAGMR